MNTTKFISKYIIYLVIIIMLVPLTAEAQRMRHGGGGNRSWGGGDRSWGGGDRSRGGENRSGSINGGYNKPTNRDFSNSSTNLISKQTIKTIMEINPISIPVIKTLTRVTQTLT